MKAKRYQVQAQARRSDVWEPIYYTDDLEKAGRYAAMALSERIQATRVIDSETGLPVASGDGKSDAGT